MKTYTKLGALGLGLYVVSSILKKATAAAEKMRPVSMQGYDMVAEALGCCNGGSFSDESAFNDGLGFSLKKKFKKAASSVKKVAVAKPMRALKKSSKLVKRDFKKAGGIVKRDFTKATKPLVRDFRKGAKLMKTDFSRAGAMFGKKKSGGSADGGIEYLDENGNVITQAQYEAQMAAYNAPETGGGMPLAVDNAADMMSAEDMQAQFEQEYGMDPGDIPGATVQSDVPRDTYADAQDDGQWFENNYGTDGAETESVPALSYGRDAADAWGSANGDVPYNGNDLWSSQFGMFTDPWAPRYLPQNIRRGTEDAFAVQQTSDNSLIMPVNEPAVPFSGDEFAVYYEQDDADQPSSDGSNYGNAQPGVYAASNYDAAGFDGDWSIEGLGAVVSRQKQRMVLAPRGMMRPSTYGYYMKPGKRVGQSPPIMPILADRKGSIYVRNGGSMHRLGCIDDLAGGPGLGCASFARDMRGGSMSAPSAGLGSWGDFFKKAEKVSKKVASRTTPSGFMYERMKKNPKLYREYRKVAKQSMPYVLIVGGAALSVASVGIASPAGAAMIAGGVASAAAQGYSDVKTAHAEKKLDRAIEQDRIAAAIDSTNVINDTQNLHPSGGPSAGEIPGGDWSWEYPGDGIVADFLDLTDSFA